LYHQFDWQNLQDTGTLEKAEKSSINQKASPGAVDIVSPLLTSIWGQRRSNNGVCDAYNHYVTKTSSSCDCGDQKCAAGCVAVAMAQVMYYWRYPVYNMDFGMLFDWCNMVDALNTNSSNYTNERNAVAYLIWMCGRAADMTYCSSGCASGTTTGDARSALVNRFEYHKEADKQMRMWHSDATWKSRMKSNLNAGRPVIYGGQSSLLFPDDAHSFVCDGYDSNDFFHFNFGWRGDHDGWYTINNLVTPNGNFNTLQDAIFYLRPKNNQDYCNFELSLLDFYLDQFNTSAPYPHIPPKYATRLTSAYPATISGFGTVPLSWYTIEPGQTVEYVAHETIVLKPGFHAKAGSNFTARIEPCANCISARITVKRINDDGVEVEEELYIAVGDNEEEQPLVSLGEVEIVADEPRVYPNPTTGLLTIHSENSNSRIQMVELYNMQGTKLFTFNGNHGFFQEIDISHLPSQVYILKIQVNGQIFIKRLILQK